jgi:two-component system cell cycle response regulator DivK
MYLQKVSGTAFRIGVFVDKPERRPSRSLFSCEFIRSKMPDQDVTRSRTILIVEDHELNMRLWNDVLEAQGYSLLKTALGIEALEIAREHHPDLILLDIRLPDISGLEVARRLKGDEATRSIPVIALTAFAQTEHQREALASGCDGYISKPVNVVNFLKTVESWLGRDGADRIGIADPEDGSQR